MMNLTSTLSAKAFILSLFFLLSASTSPAEPSMSMSKYGILFTVSPIAAFEYDRMDTPSAHSKFMFTYGARVVAGHPLFSGELEYTQGQTAEVFVYPPESITEKRQTVKLGVRSKYALKPWVSFLGRLGGQARQSTVDCVSLSGTSHAVAPWEYKPYIGLGTEVAFGNRFSLSAEGVYVIRNANEWAENEIQASLAFTARIF